MASGCELVGVCSFLQQKLNQREVLLVDGQMQCTAAVTLLLEDREKIQNFISKSARQVNTIRRLLSKCLNDVTDNVSVVYLCVYVGS